MRNIKQLEINILNTNLKYCESDGLKRCLDEYSKYFYNDSIICIGFNVDSNYSYITLEKNKINICSVLGREVEYSLIDRNTNKEMFFGTYQLALNYLQTLNT